MIHEIKTIKLAARTAINHAKTLNVKADKNITLEQKAKIENTLNELKESQKASSEYQKSFLHKIFSLFSGERALASQVNDLINQLEILIKKPLAANEEPVVAREEPVVVREEPVVVERPVVDKKPVAAREEPVVVERPVVVKEPVAAREEPVVVKEPVVVERPFTEEKKPLVNQEPPVKVMQQDPSPPPQPMRDKGRELWQAAQEEADRTKQANEKKLEQAKDLFHDYEPDKQRPGVQGVSPQQVKGFKGEQPKPSIRREDFEGLNPNSSGPARPAVLGAPPEQIEGMEGEQGRPTIDRGDFVGLEPIQEDTSLFGKLKGWLKKE